jgi:hypothetical protein
MSYFQFLEEPVKVWHLFVLGFGLSIAFSNLQKQVATIGKSVWRIIDRIEGTVEDD